MKPLHIFLISLFAMASWNFWGCDSRNPIEGVWQQRLYIGQNGDTIQRNNSYLKIITKERFAWMDFVPGDKLFRGAGGGTYKIRDGKYIEYLEYYIADSTLVGDSIVFDMKVEDDTWYHKGVWHTREYGDLEINEIWYRVE